MSINVSELTRSSSITNFIGSKIVKTYGKDIGVSGRAYIVRQRQQLSW